MTPLEQAQANLDAAARLGWCVLRFATNDLKDDPVGVVEKVTAAIGRKE